MKELLQYLFEHKSLSRNQAKEVLIEIGQGKHNASQIASFLTVYNMRSITVPELEGFRDAMLTLCNKVNLGVKGIIDIVGTGGDGKDTFNISTTAAFIVAGSGIPVAKHGNYGISSKCGSSNVLETLGVQFATDENGLKKQIEQSGFCIMHAPLFHPAMKHVGPIRREMAVRTFFNMLGPMINPAFPKNQFLGVYNLELARLYGAVYQNTDNHFTIIHALDGYDEISLTGNFKVISNKKTEILSPEALGFSTVKASELSGGDTPEDSAKILQNILSNKGTAVQQNVVLANAAFAIQTAKPEKSFPDCMMLAKESLESGKAKQALENLIKAGN